MRKVEQMEIIVAVDENYGIGKNGDLLAHLSPDLKRLKAMTVGNIIVIGSKTYMSFPKRPLPDRENIIITHRPEEYPGIRCFTSTEEFVEYSKTAQKTIFVLGGGSIYEQLLPYCVRLFTRSAAVSPTARHSRRHRQAVLQEDVYLPNTLISRSTMTTL